jgi:hypothetical protein
MKKKKKIQKKHGGGPVTALGKQISSLNALKHGIESNLPVLRTEKKLEWLAHLQALRANLKPRDYIQGLFVDEIAWTIWRLHRVRRNQTEICREAQSEETSTRSALVEFQKTEKLCQPKTIQKLAELPGPRATRRIMKWETHLSKLLTKLLNQLHEMQKPRRSNKILIDARLLVGLLKSENGGTNSAKSKAVVSHALRSMLPDSIGAGG